MDWYDSAKEGMFQPRGTCPLCGSEIVYVLHQEAKYESARYASFPFPTVLVKWVCKAGCEISVKGFVERPPAKPENSRDESEQVHIDVNPELSAKAERARRALEDTVLEDDHENHSNK